MPNLLAVAIRNWRMSSHADLMNRRLADFNDFQRNCTVVRAAEAIIRMEDNQIVAESANVIEDPFYYTEGECLYSFYALEGIRNEMVLRNEHMRNVLKHNGMRIDEERDFLFRQSFVDAINLLILRPIAVIRPKAKQHINSAYESMRKSAKHVYSVLHLLSQEQKIAQKIGIIDLQSSLGPPEEDDRLSGKVSDLVQFRVK